MFSARCMSCRLRVFGRLYRAGTSGRHPMVLLAALTVFCVSAGLLALPTASALAARGHVFETSFGKTGTGNGEFKEPQGVAVNEATGDVYVVDKGDNRVEWFSAAGAFEGQFDGSGAFEVKGKVETDPSTPPESFSEPTWIAVDNACHLHKPELSESTQPTCAEYDPSDEDVYVADAGHSAVGKFSPSGEYLGQLTEGSPGNPLGGMSGLAVDAAGELWVAYRGSEFFAQNVADFDDSQANTLIANREMRHTSGAYLEAGFALDPQHDVYLNLAGYGPEAFVIKFNESGEPVNEEFEPLKAGGDVTALSSEANSGDVYIDEINAVKVRTPQGGLLETLGAGHLSGGAGIGENAGSETVYVADAQADVVDIFAPEPPGSPTVEGASVSDVGASSATFEGEVNPRGPAGEYRFEYGPCAILAVSSCAKSAFTERAPEPDGSVGSGFPVVAVSQHVQDLLPHTTYHVRLMADNTLGGAQGEELTFTTQTLGGELALPDNRQWELVSPPNMHGAFMLPIAEGLIEASAGGDAFAGWEDLPDESQPAGNANGVYVISGRGPAGWGSRDVSTPHTYSPSVSVGKGNEFRFFSEDLSQAIVQPFGGFTPLSPEASEQTAYRRSDFPAGAPASLCEQSCYQPLVTAANVPAGTQFGEIEEEECKHFVCGPTFVGASPDAQHIVLQSPAQLSEVSADGYGGLYEWSAGRLQLLSILPDGEHNESGGSVALEASLGQRNDAARHAISNDGSRVVFEARAEQFGVHHLYLRDTAEGKTVRLDLPEGGPGSGSSEPRYMIASADGLRIFFVDEERLTSQSSQSGNDLYEYDADAPAGSRLRDLSVDQNAGEAADVVNVIGASEDGSYVYFAAAGALAQGASPGECGGNRPSAADTSPCNLYVSHEGATTLVAALSQEDFPDWAGGSIDNADLSSLTGRVSPNGRYLAFMSQRSLTGYDNADATSGKPDEEVYLYDAADGKLVCASCNPTGARPIGEEYAPGGRQISLVGADRVWNGEDWLAALIPPWTRFDLSEARYQSRYLSNSGRLFFDSRDPLVPQDVGGSWGVYEYEPPGVGSCSASSSTYSERVGGCHSLISSPTAGAESAFLDASETGGDVFFLTSEKLVPGDLSSTAHVYDAHECTAGSPCFPAPVASSPPCESGEACKSAPNLQPAVFGAPPSATFSGDGNLTLPSRRHHKHRHHHEHKHKHHHEHKHQHKHHRRRHRHHGRRGGGR